MLVDSLGFIKKRVTVIFIVVVIVSALVTLGACSSSNGPINVRDSRGMDREAQLALVKPLHEGSKVVPLVENLVGQANSALNNHRYEQAIGLAERGLRVDRREPRFYLILAQAYDLLNNTQQAIYFAQQGLRYVAAGDKLREDLLWYIQ